MPRPAWDNGSKAKPWSPKMDFPRVTISTASRGVFSRSEHKLAGKSYVGRVLVLDAAKGGVATAWMLHEMKARGVVPAALVLNAVNPIMVQGAALAGFTMISGFDLDITQAIPNGALVEVDPTGRATIHPCGSFERVGLQWLIAPAIDKMPARLSEGSSIRRTPAALITGVMRVTSLSTRFCSPAGPRSAPWAPNCRARYNASKSRDRRAPC